MWECWSGEEGALQRIRAALVTGQEKCVFEIIIQRQKKSMKNALDFLNKSRV
jgi:hypothetical protein